MLYYPYKTMFSAYKSVTGSPCACDLFVSKVTKITRYVRFWRSFFGAFSGVCLDYFQVFRRFGCAKWKYCEKWHLPAPKIWNPFFFKYLVKYSVKDFITTRQYLVNVTCNCWFRMCTQFHQKLVSYKCMLFVLFSGVARIFCKLSESDEVTGFFLEVISVLKVMSDVMFATQILL